MTGNELQQLIKMYGNITFLQLIKGVEVYEKKQGTNHGNN